MLRINLAKIIIISPTNTYDCGTISGFAFSNVTSAIEFEEQRSTFFRESRRYDEYMDIHEGLDLTDSEAFQEELFVLNTTSGARPWFTDPFYYWLSACCLLSWPFRLILYANTLPVHYKVIAV